MDLNVAPLCSGFMTPSFLRTPGRVTYGNDASENRTICFFTRRLGGVALHEISLSVRRRVSSVGSISPWGSRITTPMF